MNYINSITLLGNLTTDPRLEYLDDGKAVTEISVAVNKKNSSLEKGENVQYFNVKAWNKLGENCASSLKKGSRVLVSGYLNIKKYENGDGKKVVYYNITAKVVAASLEFGPIQGP
jgi:single-strand DNA-binding protein